MLTPLSDCLIRPRPIVEKLEANISPRLQKVLYELVVTSVMGVVSARDKRGHDDEGGGSISAELALFSVGYAKWPVWTALMGWRGQCVVPAGWRADSPRARRRPLA